MSAIAAACSSSCHLANSTDLSPDVPQLYTFSMLSIFHIHKYLYFTAKSKYWVAHKSAVLLLNYNIYKSKLVAIWNTVVNKLAFYFLICIYYY